MPGIAEDCPCLSGRRTEIGTSEGTKKYTAIADKLPPNN
jgi:hypothetical protein